MTNVIMGVGLRRATADALASCWKGGVTVSQCTCCTSFPPSVCEPSKTTTAQPAVGLHVNTSVMRMWEEVDLEDGLQVNHVMALTHTMLENQHHYTHVASTQLHHDHHFWDQKEHIDRTRTLL